MKILALVFGFLIVFGPGPFQAPALAAKGEKGAETDDGKTPDEKDTVRMPYLVAPVSVDGRLSHYIFVTYRLRTVRPNMGDRIVLVSRYIEDAYLRFIHAERLSIEDRRDTPDLEALKPRLIAAANEALGEEVITDILIDLIERPYDPSLGLPPPGN